MPQVPSDPKRSFLPDTLRHVTQFTSSRPWGTLSVVLLTSVLCVALTLQFLQFKTKRSDLIDPSAPFHQRWLRYTESFGEASDVVFVVESESPERVRQTLDDLAEKLRRHPDLFAQILYKVDLRPLRRKGLQYLRPDQLQLIAERLEEFRPLVSGGWDALRLDRFVAAVRLRVADAVGKLQTLGPSLRSGVQIASGSGHPASGTLLSGGGSPTEANGTEQIAAAEWRRVQSDVLQAMLLVESLNSALDAPERFRPPWPQVAPPEAFGAADGFEQIYLVSDDGRIGFLRAKPVSQSQGFAGPTEAIDRARDIVAQVQAAHPGVRVGLTGIPVLESDEMRKSQHDMLEASVISVVGVIVLLVIGFRGLRHPLLALVMLTVGMAWSFGYTTLTVGHLNILSVSFAVILIGLGIDFAIHYLARYLQLRHEGYECRPALLETSREVGVGIVTAAVTTAFAFFCTLLTDFLGIAELGIIAGGGVLLCAVATFVVLPPLVILADQDAPSRKLPTPFQGNWLRRLVGRYPAAVITGAVAVVLILSLQALELDHGSVRWRVRYDSNLLDLQADGVDSVETERRVAERTGGTLLFAVSMARSPQEARRLHAQYAQLPVVARVEDLASRLPRYPAEETCPLVSRIRDMLAGIDEVEVPQFGILDPAAVGGELEKLLTLLRTIPGRAPQAAAEKLDQFLDRFAALGLQEQVEMLHRYQTTLVASLLEQFRRVAAASDPTPVSLKDFPPELVSRFVSTDGKWLVQVFPKQPVWDKQPLTEFVTQLRMVDPEVTGTPIQNYEASRQIMSSYRKAACYALVVIGLILLIDFLGRDLALLALLPSVIIVGIAAVALSLRGVPVGPTSLVVAFVVLTVMAAILLDFESVRDTVLALLPPVMGGLLMFGVLGLLHIDLNPANLIVLPLILGIGVDNGVHVLHDFRMQPGPYRPSTSTMNAIVLTSLTSMIGFGSLMVSSHRGLYSLGVVLVVGIGGCLFVSLVLLPALLTLLSLRRLRTIQQDEADSNGSVPIVTPDDAAA